MDQISSKHSKNKEPEEIFNSDDDTSDIEDESNEEEITFANLDINSTVNIPKHYHCGSHTISLITTTDFNNALKSDRGTYVIHSQAFLKCNALWKKGNRPKSSEIIVDIIGSTLKTPCVTRWNSLYDSTLQLLNNESNLTTL
ncbi:uncharacterized protein LOC119603282 [Lucilia sericata]|uniref:uncharacterized protein LOC119603282 n=1 Tax=Lucilia sericata TaxID=13632 RepID=UPI0018A84A8A|nr:uncharacterized protein LOC119603282 [Lucilia sericata]